MVSVTLVEYDDNLVVSPNIERKIIIELRNYTEKRIEIFQTNNEDLQKYRIKLVEKEKKIHKKWHNKWKLEFKISFY